MPEHEINAFDQLVLEKERTLFMFYGFRRSRDGSPGAGYFKLAYSLSEALADLVGNPGVANLGGYLVNDAFIEVDEDGEPPTVQPGAVEYVQDPRQSAGRGGEGGRHFDTNWCHSLRVRVELISMADIIGGAAEQEGSN
ncbi:MAG: hypothetical protein WA484_10265 [Solirubrobacteraceae bacterium]